MARSADIDFSFSRKVEITEALDLLIENGASIVYKGKLTYVVDHDQAFNWQRSDPSKLNQILSAAKQSDASTTTFGISLILDTAESGGDLLFQPGRKVISFIPEINRVLLQGSKICDFSWYLRRLLPAFEPLGLDTVEASDY